MDVDRVKRSREATMLCLIVRLAVGVIVTDLRATDLREVNQKTSRRR